MKVLLVAPQTNLSLVQAEVQDILRSDLVVTPLIGEVTSTQLLREIKAGGYDVLWFATHGGEYDKTTGQFTRDLKIVEQSSQQHYEIDYGVQLSDGMLSMSDLTALVRGRFRLVVLNTCDSYQIAQQLQVEANVSVVCTILSVPDKDAYRTGSLFASRLAEGLPVSRAYALSIPGSNRVYLYLAALEPAQESIDNVLSAVEKLSEKIETQAKADAMTIKLLWRVVYGLAALHIPEWIALYLLWRL